MTKPKEVREIDPRNDRLQWAPDDKITITGIEFHALMQIVNQFETAVLVKNAILARMVQEGVAKRVTPEAIQEEITDNPEPESEAKVIPIAPVQESV